MKTFKSLTINKDSVFFLIMLIWYLLIIHLGFYHSVSKKGLSMDYSVIIHGVVFSFWILLFAIQIVLIASDNRKMHSKMGFFNVVIVIALIATGIYTIFGIIPKKDNPFQEVGTDLVLLSAFLCFYILGLMSRKDAIKHKRHMFFATMALTSAAIPRIAFLNIEGNKTLQILLLLFPIVMLFGYDFVVRKKIYKVNIQNLLVFVASIQVMKFFWKTKTWETMANWMYNQIH